MHQTGRAAEIKAIGIGKSFGQFRALNDLTLDVALRLKTQLARRSW